MQKRGLYSETNKLDFNTDERRSGNLIILGRQTCVGQTIMAIGLKMLIGLKFSRVPSNEQISLCSGTDV
jgi:hypothetical protein